MNINDDQDGIGRELSVLEDIVGYLHELASHLSNAILHIADALAKFRPSERVLLVLFDNVLNFLALMGALLLGWYKKHA